MQSHSQNKNANHKPAKGSRQRDKAPKRRVPPRRARNSAAIAEHELAEPTLPVGAMLEIADWVLDLARDAATDDRDDINIVERVRAYVHARARGLTARSPSESELLTAVALAVAAMEKRHGIVGLGELVAQSLDDEAPLVPHTCRSFRVVRRSPRLAPHPYCVP